MAARWMDDGGYADDDPPPRGRRATRRARDMATRRPARVQDMTESDAEFEGALDAAFDDAERHKPITGINAQNSVTNGSGQKQMPSFSNLWRIGCSAGAQRRAWKRIGRCRAFPKTASTCDKLIWLPLACSFHPAPCRGQLCTASARWNPVPQGPKNSRARKVRF